MSQYNYILYCREGLIKNSFLFLIGLILCSYNLVLGATPNSVCPKQLTAIPLLDTVKGVRIDISEARFIDEYYPEEIENLHWKLGYLSGGGHNPVSLVLKTADGQLDLLESTFTITIAERSNEQVDANRRELKYSLFDMFADKLKLKDIAVSDHTTLRRMRLVIMEAFPETFSDFINGRAIDSSDSASQASLGLIYFNRRQVLTAIVEDLNGMVDKKTSVHQTVVRKADDETSQAISTIREHLLTPLQNAATREDVANTGNDIAAHYDFDSFRSSLFSGPLSRRINEFFEDPTINLRIERLYPYPETEYNIDLNE